MVSEGFIDLHVSSDSNIVGEKNVEFDPNAKNNTTENESQNTSDDCTFTMEGVEQQKEENKRIHPIIANLDKVPIGEPPIQSVELVESLTVSHASIISQMQEDGISEMDGGEKSDAECMARESSVRVLYASLPSRSKKKLEELLHHWSEWHAKNCALLEDPVDSLESGEETYFPALHVGSDKPSTVSFSMDVHMAKRPRKGLLATDNDCSPLYDRGFAVGLASDERVTEERAVDVREAPRCFNCGSYNHALSDCSKPRDNNAVNSARKQFLNKKSLNAGPRVPTRYYQESPGGKFDGLKPGTLSAETRKLLGIGEFDPPPWLNRMRDIGYPPGYLDTEEEDKPSGIAIYDDDESDNAKANDLPLDAQKSQKKMTVDFPGVNAVIPENGDQWLWTAPQPRAPPPVKVSWNHTRNSMRPNYLSPPSHFGYGGSSPLVNSQYPHHHYPTESFSPRGGLPIPSSESFSPRGGLPFPSSESFSPRGLPIASTPSYGRPSNPGMPLLHFNYGSL